jgi:hypothetical protein
LFYKFLFLLQKQKKEFTAEQKDFQRSASQTLIFWSQACLSGGDKAAEICGLRSVGGSTANDLVSGIINRGGGAARTGLSGTGIFAGLFSASFTVFPASLKTGSSSLRSLINQLKMPSGR